MTTILTAGAQTVVPDLVLGYEAENTANNIIHTILGRPEPDVTLRPASLRTGTLRMFFLTEPEAREAVNLHKRPAVITLTDTTWPAIDMRYVVAGGAVKLTLEPQTGKRWLVDAPFQEVI